jgi:hypothetical protein
MPRKTPATPASRPPQDAARRAPAADRARNSTRSPGPSLPAFRAVPASGSEAGNSQDDQARSAHHSLRAGRLASRKDTKLVHVRRYRVVRGG